MGALRSALYLDFDNVFSGLLKLDPAVAFQFAQAPEGWLARLRESGSPRRWLVLRCYMNPSGSVVDPRTDGVRVNFFRFRSAFTDAGFEVVDCPRLSHTKNGADIRLVIDAVEALRADAHYEEFVIASGDSDMTPLLVRLRAADRAVTLMSPSDLAVVMQSVADRLIGGDELVELIDTRVDELEASLAIEMEEPPFDSADLNEADARALFRDGVLQRYADAQEPLNLAALASRLRAELGPVTTASGWFGHGGFLRAIQALDLPGMRIEGQYLWDNSRHLQPEGADQSNGADMPETVIRVTSGLKVPALSPASWKRTYECLATFCSLNEFNLTEMTRWTRDQLRNEGLPTNRHAPALVVSGAAYGGCPLHGTPPPTEVAIARAFVRNLLDRAAAAQLELSTEDATEVHAWFASPPAV